MEAYQLFEHQFSEWTGRPNMVGCSSGSAALHLALESLDLPRGSQVLVPEFAMIACARAVTLAGLRPVFVDCGDDLLMNLDAIKAKITKQTSALLAVHIYGRACKMKELADLCSKRKIKLVEDCAEYHGGSLDHYADASCWSFYKNKIVAGEEGGAVSFYCKKDADRARCLRSHGFTDAHNFTHVPRGWNYRLSNVHSHLLLDSLAKVKENLSSRRLVETWYNDAVPKEYQMPSRDVCWVYDLRIRGFRYAELDAVVDKLNSQGVAARCGFRPMTWQVEYWRDSCRSTRAFLLSNEVMYLPVHPSMKQSQVKKNAELFCQAVEQFR